MVTKGCDFSIESEGRIAHASTAALAIVSQSTIVSNSASHHHGQTSPSALAHKFRPVSACNCALLARRYHLPWHGTFLPSICGIPAFFSDLRLDDLQVYLARVYLRKKNWHVNRVRGDKEERDKYCCVWRTC
jgi:hypothetical protein